MKELVIISGKGGTGKTSITASMAVMARNPVIVDCDVDAADLHLLLSPKTSERHDFYSGRKAVIIPEKCTACGACQLYCRFSAIKRKNDEFGSSTFFVDPIACEGCGLCVRFCPEKAIDFPENLCGEWRISETRCGTMLHARLNAAEGNSGKLVSTLRTEAKKEAEKNGSPLIIVDGPPGIGCPVIASLTGADQVLVITEPTVSGEHDLQRVLDLSRHFKIPAAVCVNKWDINPDMTEQIEKMAEKCGARVVGRISYDKSVTRAQIQGLTVVEIVSDCAAEIKRVWEQLGLQETTDYGKA
jgi:MinD superfamily P-loop ATPase